MNKTTIRKPKYIITLLLILTAVFIFWINIEPLCLRTTTYTIQSPQIPSSFTDFKIALITDLHIGKYTTLEHLQNVIAKIKNEAPDIIVLGGDYVYKYSDNYDDIFEPFTESGIPVYAVSGNHDHWENYTAIMAAARNAGVQLLEDDVISLTRSGSSIQLAGVPDLWYPQFSDSNLRNKRNDSVFTLLVSHNPDYLVENTELYDVGLAGHTHGGQLTFFGLWAPFLPVKHTDAAWKGRTTIDGSEIIISNGIGTVEMPLRFFAPPEVVIVTLAGF